jgi:hypothetical protein
VTLDETMTAITDAVALGHQGDKDTARKTLEGLWQTIGPQGDPLHRCTLAHYLADLHDDPAVALGWDIRALDAAGCLDGDRAKQYHAALDVQAFYPSLHLNLAENYRKLGSFTAAESEISQARGRLSALTEGPYGDSIRAALEQVSHKVINRHRS